jgi:orotate phosphoribosyltransferase
LLEGHFVLSSGLHSSVYLQCALVLQHPPEAESFARALAASYQGESVETVAAPAIGGLVIGYEVARALGARFLWTERDAEGHMTLRRGFTIRPGESVLVVEDVITTGGSTRETIEALKSAGARIVGAASRPFIGPRGRRRPTHRARHTRRSSPRPKRLPPLRTRRAGRQAGEQERSDE